MDAEELHEPGYAVLARSLDLEVGRRIFRSASLRPDAGIARGQRAIGKAGPIAPDGAIETLGAQRIDVVVDSVDPFHVRPEARLPGEIERDMNAEAAGLGHRIDQSRERTLPGQRIIVALGVELTRYEFAIESFERL